MISSTLSGSMCLSDWHEKNVSSALMLLGDVIINSHLDYLIDQSDGLCMLSSKIIRKKNYQNHGIVCPAHSSRKDVLRVLTDA